MCLLNLFLLVVVLLHPLSALLGNSHSIRTESSLSKNVIHILAAGMTSFLASFFYRQIGFLVGWSINRTLPESCHSYAALPFLICVYPHIITYLKKNQTKISLCGRRDLLPF